MIMKSRMMVNCKNASTPTTNFWYGVNAGGGPGPGPRVCAAGGAVGFALMGALSIEHFERGCRRRDKLARMSSSPQAPAVASVASVLGGKVPVGAAVTVRGWVRTRRDSKA